MQPGGLLRLLPLALGFPLLLKLPLAFRLPLLL